MYSRFKLDILWILRIFLAPIALGAVQCLQRRRTCSIPPSSAFLRVSGAQAIPSPGANIFRVSMSSSAAPVAAVRANVVQGFGFRLLIVALPSPTLSASKAPLATSSITPCSFSTHDAYSHSAEVHSQIDTPPVVPSTFTRLHHVRRRNILPSAPHDFTIHHLLALSQLQISLLLVCPHYFA